METTQIYFSPSGGCAKISNIFCKTACGAASGAAHTIDLLNHIPTEPISFTENQVAVFTFPVFGGRLPTPVPKLLANLHGQNTPAIVMVAYGNREYEDSLRELADLVSKAGFSVVGAAAFVARHSIFPQVAAGRPDTGDVDRIKKFAMLCLQKLKKQPPAAVSLHSDEPYRDIPEMPRPVKPTGNHQCIKCGICAAICPMQAISADNPRKTDFDKCIACTACTYACPQNARGLRNPLYKAAAMAFEKKNRESKQPVWFV